MGKAIHYALSKRKGCACMHLKTDKKTGLSHGVAVNSLTDFSGSHQITENIKPIHRHHIQSYQKQLRGVGSENNPNSHMG